MPIKLLGSTSGYLILDAPAIANNATLTLPQSANGAFLTAGDTNTFTKPQIFEVTDDSTAALRITQLGTADAIRVEDDTNPDSSPFVIDANGKIGIGLTSPNARLDVKNTSAGTNDIRLSFSSTDYLGFSSQSDGYQIGVIGGSNALRFATGGTERMRITSSGDVGIGGSPSYKLDVTATGTSIASAFRTDQTEAWIGLKDSGTTFGHVRLGSTSGAMIFYAANAERMRIDSSGRVGIRVTPTEDFQVGLALKVRTQSTGDRLVAHADGNGGSQYFYYNASNLYGTVSDERSKENISAIDEQEALDFILRITPAQFSLKDQTDIQAGFIAQDILAAAHDDAQRSAVAYVSSYSPDDPDCPMLGVSERPIVAMLVAAMKKQQATITALEARIATLEAI